MFIYDYVWIKSKELMNVSNLVVVDEIFRVALVIVVANVDRFAVARRVVENASAGHAFGRRAHRAIAHTRLADEHESSNHTFASISRPETGVIVRVAWVHGKVDTLTERDAVLARIAAVEAETANLLERVLERAVKQPHLVGSSPLSRELLLVDRVLSVQVRILYSQQTKANWLPSQFVSEVGKHVVILRFGWTHIR